MVFRTTRQAGFTLLEILAAFVIFALVFATTLQILSGSLRNTAQSSEYTQAALWAESLMDRVGIDPPLEAGAYDGDFDDDYWWELEISPYAVAEAGEGGEAAAAKGNLFEVPIEVYLVDLRIFWGEPDRPRSAAFRTLRSVTAQP